jgi:hypothetical protein
MIEVDEKLLSGMQHKGVIRRGGMPQGTIADNKKIIRIIMTHEK